MEENSYTSNFKLVAYIVLVVITVAFSVNKLGTVYAEASKNNKINAFTKARFDEFYSLPKDSIDMVFIGSSHSYCTFDPKNFSIKAYQMGTPLQHPDTSYYSLLNVLEHQSPKIAVVEVYWDMLDDDFELNQANSFFEVVNSDSIKNDYIKNVFPMGDKVKSSMPIIKNQQSYFAYKSKEIEKSLEEDYNVYKEITPTDAKGEEYYKELGYVYCDIIIPESEFDKTNQFKGLNGNNWEFSKVQKFYLEKIIRLCNEKGIRLVFVTAPIANVSMDYIENYDIINSKVASFARSNNIPYIDYNIINIEEKMFEINNFRDDAHLNDSGVKILDNHFQNWLIENNIYDSIDN